MAKPIGDGLVRLDAHAKASGRAQYAGDLPAEGALRLSLVLSQCCAGRIRSIETAAATSLRGVVGVMTHVDAPRLESVDCLTLLQNTTVLHAGQPVAVVAAKSFAQARQAAALVTADIEPFHDRDADFIGHRADAIEPLEVLGEAASSIRGNPDLALAASGITRIDATYTTPTHVHSPLEPHTVTARWDGDNVV